MTDEVCICLMLLLISGTIVPLTMYVLQIRDILSNLLKKTK